MASGVNVTVEIVPLPMLLTCPACGERHIDEGEFETKPHHTHACQSCGMVWRPAIVPTVGVRFLPGFKDAPAARCEWCEATLDDPGFRFCYNCPPLACRTCGQAIPRGVTRHDCMAPSLLTTPRT